MFIDIHAHCYRRKVPFVTQFCNPNELIKRYDELKIEKGALLPVVNPEIYITQSVEDILEICENYPDRFIPFCNLDPRALTNSPYAPLSDVLLYYKDKGCKGIGEVMCNLKVDDPLVQNLFYHAEISGLPLTYDGSDQLTGDFGLYDEPGLPQLEHSLQKFPNLTILGHGPVFWAEIAKLETPASRGVVFNRKGEQLVFLPDTPIKEEGVVPKFLRKYKNLHLDLSDCTAYNALTRDLDYGPAFLTEFADRAYFGTDFCGFNMQVPLTELLIKWKKDGRLSSEVFEKIARENAIKLLKL